MTIRTLDLPPGIQRAGTTYASRGRWFDSTLTRFFAGTKGPVGGWVPVKDTQGSNVALTGIPRGMLAWRGNDGRIWLAIGTSSKIYAYNNGTLTDLTPGSGFTAGPDSTSGVGSKYGRGKYGRGLYGKGTIRQAGGSKDLPLQVAEVSTWQLDTFGQFLVGVLSSDGKIRFWDLKTANDMVLVATDAPDAAAVVTTPERFIFALGATLKASAVLTFTGQPANSEAVTIDGKIYTFQTTLTNVDGNVLIGASTNASIDNLVAAIILGAGAGTTYAAATTLHQTVTAARVNSTLKVTARTGGDSQNTIALLDGIANATWGSTTLAGGYGSVRTVRWPKRETLDKWDMTELDTTAGDYPLKTDGRLVCGRRTPRETLLFTDTDLHAAIYIGGVLLYAFDRRGANCGILAPNAVALVGDKAYWMGHNGFFRYEGAVTEVICEVQDYIFSDLNRVQRHKIWAVSNAQFNEIWWFYPSGGADEVDRYVVYNYVEDHWTIGKLVRTTGVDRGPFEYPIWADALGGLWEHERSSVRTLGGTPYLESGPLELGEGEQISTIRESLPDEKNLGEVELTIFSAFDPTGPEITFGPYTMTEPTPIRATGRQHRVRLQEKTANTDWRVGAFRFDVVPEGWR